MLTCEVVESPELVELVSQPELSIESVTRFVQGDRFAISDTNGNILGYREKQGSGLKNIVKPSRPFVVKVVDPSGHRLLTIRRPMPVMRTRFEVYVPDENGGSDILLGGGKLVKLHPKSRYDLYEQNNHDNIFARVRAVRTAVPNRIEADSGAVVASIHRQTIYRERPVGYEKTSRSDTYGLHMDASAGRDPDRKVDLSLSLDQRAIILALSIVLDIDYYTNDVTERLAFAGGNMFGISMDFE